MQQEAVVITPNNRLSKELLIDYGNVIDLPAKKPICLPYQTFIVEELKRHTSIPPLLLTYLQTRQLWRQILVNTQSNVNRGLLDLVEQAWVRCYEWQVDINHLAFTYTPQTQQFQQWAQELQAKLSQLQAITHAQVCAYLCRQGHIFNIKTLIWSCFDDLTPQQEELQNYLLQQNCQLYHYDLKQNTSCRYQYVAENEEAEYKHLLHWLQEHLLSGKKRIAVVVPNLESKSANLQRNMQQNFSDEQFNISLGKSLITYPLVTHAFVWLQIDGAMISNHDACLLLHSPYLAYSQTEFCARTEFLENNHILSEINIPYSKLVAQLRPSVPGLAGLLDKITSYPVQAEVQTWIALFQLRLKLLGFPGEINLDSDTYQCYQRFLTLFDDFKQLATITTNMAKNEALAIFRELAELTIFQPQKSRTPIQILGLLEASGCTFDSLWLTGLTEDCFPKTQLPSPLIPIILQRKHKMPHTNPGKELLRTQKIISRLQNACNLAIFSYPKVCNDIPNLPSPFIVNLPHLQSQKLISTKEMSSLESFVEKYHLPLLPTEKRQGGTSILTNQAKCQFRAFAAHRLHLKKEQQSSMGLDIKERGRLLHTIMELLWQKLKNQRTLVQLQSSILDEEIAKIMEIAFAPFIQQRPYSFSPLIQEVETIRLQRLVHTILHWERQRPEFTVQAVEQAFSIHLGEMQFNIRIDRLDSTEDNKIWVIDYKSTIPQPLPWKTSRPTEPQLLLYALADKNINTLLFVQLKSEQIKLKGLTILPAENIKFPGLLSIHNKHQWSDLTQQWSHVLHELADEYTKGFCQPEPSKPSICKSCDYQNLCRMQHN